MRTIFFLFFFLLLRLSSQSQGYVWSDNDSKRIIETLAADSLQGRRAGTEYEKKSLEFIQTEFKKTFGKKLKTQSFYAQLAPNDSVICQNGYYFFHRKKKKTILISAHYEHIGLGGALSKAPSKVDVHNGADDNASGVAAVFQTVAELLNANVDYNILVVFYSAHEIGLFGSKAFEQKVESKKFKSVFMHINFDMVGRLDPTTQRLYFSCSETLKKHLPTDLLNNHVVVTESISNRLEMLDTKWSVLAQRDAITLTTGLHVDYHKPSDDAVYIDYAGIRACAELVRQLISNIHS